MTKAAICKLVLTIFLCLGPSAFVEGEELQPILLPPAQTNGGKPLMECLQQRRTTREFKADKLSPQTLANLLWAGFGINRPLTDHRTAPSAMNSQEIDIYVASPEGLYLYDAKLSQLKASLSEDFRGKTGGQDFVKQAPVTLIYVADLSRLAKSSPQMKPAYAEFDAGCICQNIYLYCASAGLGTVVHDLDRVPLAKAMKLGPDQQIIFAQVVGYPR